MLHFLSFNGFYQCHIRLIDGINGMMIEELLLAGRIRFMLVNTPTSQLLTGLLDFSSTWDLVEISMILLYVPEYLHILSCNLEKVEEMKFPYWQVIHFFNSQQYNEPESQQGDFASVFSQFVNTSEGT